MTSSPTQSPARSNRRRPKPAPPPPPAPPLRERLREARARLWAGLSFLRRPVIIVLRLGLVGALALGAVAVGQLVERHVRTSAAFATVELHVDGAERLSREQVLAVAGLALGNNVFDVSPEAAEAALNAHPWIAEAKVTRRLPGSYFLFLREREATALAVLDALYLVGDDARLFKTLEPGDPVDLPVITGLQDDIFQQDPVLRAGALVSAVALLHDYRDAGLWRREPIGEIHVDPDSALSLYVGDEVTQVRLGQRPFRKKLRRFRKVLERLDDEKARPAYVYLDNARRPDRVTVRLR